MSPYKYDLRKYVQPCAYWLRCSVNEGLVPRTAPYRLLVPEPLLSLSPTGRHDQSHGWWNLFLMAGSSASTL
jgi:hypothetical protein